MALRRPKHPTIYQTVSDWWNNDNGVPYIAHAILNNGNAVALLNAPVQGEGNQNYAIHHPDQQFWADNRAAIKQRIQPHLANLSRIEIDCPLLPCVQHGGCVYRVPALIRAVFPGKQLDNVTLRIFSHRDEGVGGKNGNESTKRYYPANTDDGNDNAMMRYNAHDGWGWTPWVNAQGYV